MVGGFEEETILPLLLINQVTSNGIKSHRFVFCARTNQLADKAVAAESLKGQRYYCYYYCYFYYFFRRTTTTTTTTTTPTPTTTAAATTTTTTTTTPPPAAAAAAATATTTTTANTTPSTITTATLKCVCESKKKCNNHIECAWDPACKVMCFVGTAQ